MNRRLQEGLPDNTELKSAARAYIEALFNQYPMAATELGVHDYDRAMTDWSPSSRDRYLRRLRECERLVSAVNPERLSPSDRADWEVLSHGVALALDDETEDRAPERDPNLANSLVAAALLPLMRMEFGTPDERAEAAASRLQLVPEFLQHAQALWENPPELFVAVAVKQYQDTIPFLEEDVPQAFRHAGPVARRRVNAAAAQAQDAYRRTIRALVALEDKAHGDFALGAERYGKRLELMEHVSTPLPRLLHQGYEELNRLRQRLAETVTGMDADLGVHEAVLKLYRQHPVASELLGDVSGVLDELKAFVVNHDLVTVPRAPHPAVVETPAFMRATTFASIWPPGPFEQEAEEAYYQVTLPDPAWPTAEQEAHLGGFNPWGQRIISAHEVYPGHYLQFLHLPRSQSSVRKLIPSGAFTEGWAHYAEELMLEAGYGHGQPEMWISQTMEALERVGRYIMGIRLHTGDATYDEAVQFFEEQCFMQPVAARREALRGTMDPFYLIYTLGKLQILELRQEAQRQWGAQFSLRRFHDGLLSFGFPPVPVAGRLLLTP
jgi:uncharacterized protein (DUF885 family)